MAVQLAQWGDDLWQALLPLVPLLAGSRPDTVTLRSAKSEESLSSQASGAGEQGWALHVLKQQALWGIEALVLSPNVVFQIWGFLEYLNF